LFDPAKPLSGGCLIVVEFYTGEDLNVGILFAKPIDHIKVDAGMVPIMICECEASDTAIPTSVNPRLKKIEGIRPDLMALGMRVVI
jgi:hypothetical protein